MAVNMVTIDGKVKWEPRVFKANGDKKAMTQFVLEHQHFNSQKKSQFYFKSTGDNAESLSSINVGDELKITGSLSVANWKDKDDNWESRTEVFVKSFERVDSVSDDDIPF